MPAAPSACSWPHRPCGRRCGGVALVIVLCALFLLSMVIFGLAQRLNQEIFLSGRDARALEARALAYSGVQIALHPRVKVRTPALRHQVDAQHGYQARLVGEGGKLHLNWLLQGEDPDRLALLRRYLEIRGLNFQDRETLVDCLLDYVGGTGKTHLNGSQTTADGEPVPGRAFLNLAEVRRVAHAGVWTSQPGWDHDLTLLSQGPIDLQWAPVEVIASLPGVGVSRATAFVRERAGRDQLDGTADDRLFTDVGEAETLLNLNVQQNPAIQALVTLNDQTVRIVSVGQSVDVTRTIEVVARKDTGQPRILQWKED